MTRAGSHPMPGRARVAPASRVSPEAAQAVLDAAAILQVRRSDAATLAASGTLTEGKVVAVGLEAAQQWLHASGSSWSENLSVRPTASAAQLRASLPANRAFVSAGVRMVSVFDYYGLDTDARLLLANEPIGDYLFGKAPLQMKIIDRSFVVLEGPVVDGAMSLMTHPLGAVPGSRLALLGRRGRVGDPGRGRRHLRPRPPDRAAAPGRRTDDLRPG